MDFVREQLSNIDNHHYLTIVFGKHNENNSEANMGKVEFERVYKNFINKLNYDNNNILSDVYRDYLNEGIIYRYRENKVNCIVEETIENTFTEIDNRDAYLFLTKKSEHNISHFPIDKEMDDIKDKSEIIINIDNLFNVVFLSYNNKVYYYKIVIMKYNIYGDKLISRLDEILKVLSNC